MKRALFAGRFQPFHNGHLSEAHKILDAPDIDELVMGIGSAQYSHTERNPFSADERERMIRKSFYPEKAYHIAGINDAHDDLTWTQVVEKSCPGFDVVYTGNAAVGQLFEKHGYEVRPPDARYVISATEIRKMMLFGDGWKQYVPQGAIDVIDDIDGARRVKETVLKYERPVLVTDLIIQYSDTEKSGIVLIKRREEPFRDFWALPGGHYEPGRETIENAAVREAREETGLNIQTSHIMLLGIYSEPGRDPRGNYVSAAYYTEAYGGTNGIIKAGSDAKEIDVFSREEMPRLAFDHEKMLKDYFAKMDRELDERWF